MIETKAWDGVFRDAGSVRMSKPRPMGLNMVIDKNLGPHALSDLLETAGDAIDHIKLAFGTTVALSERAVRDKIEMIRSQHIEVYPGRYALGSRVGSRRTARISSARSRTGLCDDRSV